MKAATRHIAQRLSFVPNAGRYSGALTGKNNPAESIIVVFKPKTSGEKAKPTMVLSELAGRMPKPTMVLSELAGRMPKPTMVLSELAGRMPKPTMVFPFCLQ